MNALPSIQPPAIPEVSSAAGASAAPVSATSGTGKSTFAGALQDAGAKPARKATSSKTSDPDKTGASLPINGNVSPPPPAPVPAVIPIAAAAGATTEVGLPPVNVGSNGSPGAAALPQGTATGANEVPAPGFDVAIPSGAAAAFATLFGDSAANRVANDTPTPTDPSAPPAALATAASGPQGPPLVGAPALSVAPAIVASAAASPPALGKSQRQMLAGTAISHAGAQVKAASRGAALTGNDAVDAGDSETATSTGAASGIGVAEAGAAGAVPSSDPGTLLAAATAGARPAVSANTGDSGDTSAPIAGVAAADTAGTGGAAGAAGSPGVAATVTLAAARAAVMNAANGFTLQTGGVNNKHSQNGADTSGTMSGADAALGVSQTSSSAVSAADAASATPTFRIAASVDSADFSQGIADHVSWMASNELNGAKLQVNPAQLGPIELRISVTGDHAQVWMSTHSAVTRDALEASSPKLREMLGAQGFGQVSVDISQRSFQDRSTYAQPYQPPASKSAAGASVSSINASATPRASTGVLDAYA